MYIRSIEDMQKSKKRVCLSNGTDFVLYKKEVLQWQLVEEMELSQNIYEQILHEILIPRAKKRAMHLLEKMDRSEMQLRVKLKENGYPPEAIDEAISYVASYHYIDDERLASSYIRFYHETRSKMRISQDLQKKGISKDIISRCLEEEYQTNEVELIKELLQKKHYNEGEASQQEKAKMYRFLMQRGFRSSDISRALRLDNI